MVNTKCDTSYYDSRGYQRKIFDGNVLYESKAKAMKGSDWKPQVQRFNMTYLLELSKMQRDLEYMEYEFLPTTNFTLHERGKLRRITGEQVQDRIVKHALCDEVLNPLIETHLIYDNGASVVGKGIAFTRKRLLTHLRKYYAQHGSNEGYILLIDFSKYYDNIRHDVLLKLFEQYVDDEHALWLLRKTVERSRVDVSYMSDEEYEHCLDKLFDSLLYQYMNPKLFTGEKFMGKHLNIGDQVAQTAGISYRIRIDNYVKIVRGVKFYAGYMDDSYAIHESKEFLQELLEDIIEIANELGITVNTRKTRICKLSEHWRFLQVQYSLTDTGRVIQKINPKRLTAMRRKMKKLAPKLTEKEFTDFYKSWFKNHYKIMSKKQRSNMDALFNQSIKGGNEMYTITLVNGTKLTGLDMNGTNYVSKEKVDETIFKDNLSTMKVSDGETETTYTDMVFIQQMEWADGTFYLAFREKTKEEKLVAALNATSNSITDVQVALAEVYEMVLGGN